MRRFVVLFLFLVSVLLLRAQPGPGGGGGAAATFGSVVPVVGGAADLVLDEPRGRLYLVNSSQSRVEVYSIAQRRFLTAIRTDALPLAAAIARNGRWLYVTCFDGSALNVIDLESGQVANRVSLPAKPEGVAVGADERVLISTIGTGANNLFNILLVYNPDESAANSLSSVQITPPAPQSPQLPPTSGRIFLASRSQLLASQDGSLIVGVNIPNNNSRTVFVYEVASGTVLRSRTVLNVSSVLSISPDNSRFMTGLSLFDTQTLEILAQQNVANAPYPFQPGTNFNLQQNQGGSVYSPDGSVLYSAFNVAPIQTPPLRPNVSELMLSDPDNLLIRMGIKVTENLAGKMVISSDGASIYALSESGFVGLPVGSITQSPIVATESNVVLLGNDQCGVTSDVRRGTVAARNEGRGRFTLQAQLLQQAPQGPGGIGGVGGAGGGLPGGPIVIVIPPTPGRVEPGPIAPGGTQPGAQGPQNAAITGTSPQVRTVNTADGAQVEFVYTPSAAGRNPGTISPTHTFILQSNEAINIPPSVRVFQNFRDAESRSEIVPVPVGPAANEALEDLAMDQGRGRLYIANSGLNRIDVFDTRRKQLMASIKVGQLPRALAMSPDGNLLYVVNTGGESISVVDLDKMEAVDRIHFPPLPFNSNAPLVTPSAIAASLRGPLIVMSNGTIWRVVGNTAVPRAISPAIGSSTIAAPRSMAATPNGEYVIVMAGNGFVYLYDALADEFIQGRQIFNNPIQGYFGPVAAGPRGQYFLANGTVLNQALTPISSAGTLPVPGQTNQTLNRPISAVAAGAGNTFVRFSQPLRTNTAAPAAAPAIELVDAQTGQMLRSSASLEGPLSAQIGNQRVNVNGRTMAVDAAGTTAYAITTSGLSIVPLDAQNPADRPVPNPSGIVNLTSYVPAFAPGGLVSIFGRNLAEPGAIGGPSAPSIMGGVCVTYNNSPLPLLMTSPDQINAQIPPEIAPGRGTVQVRNIVRKSVSLPQAITIARYAPAVFTNPETGEAAVFHADGSLVTAKRPAKRDERLTLYATGLGVTKGGRVIGGQAAPSDPLAITDDVDLYFGDPRMRQSEMIVEWSGLVPGFIGVYQINLRVPGEHMRGSDLPVTLRIGGVESQKSGPAVPVVSVD